MNTKFKLICFVLLIGVLGSYLNGKKLISLPQVSKPYEIFLDDKQLVIADSTNQLHLYSLKGFKYQMQLFKHGEGPSEGLCLGFVWVSTQYINLYCMGKNSFFTRDGKFVKEFRTPIASTMYIRPVGDKFICEKHENNRNTRGLSCDISLYSLTEKKEMKFEKVLYFYEIPPISWKGNRRPLIIIKQIHDVNVFDNRIFICDSERGLFFQVYDLNGNKLYQVKLEWETLKVPANYSNELFKEIKEKGKMNSFNSQFYYDQPEYFPGFYRFYVGKNKIYFLTYKRIGDTREVITCDWYGKSVKKAYIPWMSYGDLRNCTVWNNKFYYLVDNQDTEEWELHVADIK